MNNKGQFTIIAALLVAVILVAAVMTTYSSIRYSQLQDQPQILSAIDETNLALKQILGFTVGYYGSVLKVTGDSAYARLLAMNYLSSGLNNIGDIRPEWGTSFNISKIDLSTVWYTNTSYSQGAFEIKYNLTGLGIYNVIYETSARLDIEVSPSNSTSYAQLKLMKDNEEPLINLGRQNFKFYRYSNSSWDLVNPTSIMSYANGTYSIGVPPDVSWDAYTVEVEDNRGIIVTASSFSQYNAQLGWNTTYMVPTDNLVIELLQNGTMRWLGQNLNLTQTTKPIPPIPVKDIRVNQTVNGVNREVPFQIEDWASDYRVPLGLTSNASVFSNRNMIVCLVNSQVSKVTIWWDGHDTANQTSYSIVNRYNLTVNTSTKTLSNGNLTMQMDFSNGFRVDTTRGTATTSATLMRINTKVARYGDSEPTYAVTGGIVRLIVHHEVEWGESGSEQIPNCTNVYAHIVLTLPANATYYTYQLRFMFLDAGLQNRRITDFCPINLTTTQAISQLQTENGTTNGIPVVTSGSSSYYNFTGGKWAHHWSQFTWSSETKGAGIMFTNSANQMLYRFDTIAGHVTGALKTDNVTKTIELLPVTTSYPVSFQSALDVTWCGAVVTFDGTTPIYKQNSPSLWMLIEYPPQITVSVSA